MKTVNVMKDAWTVRAVRDVRAVRSSELVHLFLPRFVGD